MSSKITANDILKKYHWKPWLARPFYGFMVSLFEGGNAKKYFKKLGIPNAEYTAWMSNGSQWYQSEELYEEIRPALEKWLKKHSLVEVTTKLEKYYKKEKKIIKEYSKNPEKNLIKKAKHSQEVLKYCTTFIWLAHCLEHIFVEQLNREASKFVSPDKLDEFIRLATSPKKLTATEKMDKAILSGSSLKKVVAEYGWTRCRDGFCDPYSLDDMRAYAKNVKPAFKHDKVIVPKELVKLISEASELVYFRTQRTDVFYELLYLSRPIFKALGNKYGINFSDLKYYPLPNLIAGKPLRLPEKFSVIGYKDKAFYFDNPLIKEIQQEQVIEVKGNIAQKGKFVGTVKVVNNVNDLNKVKNGDVMVTFMTAPNFLPAMRLAGAFVTNEGGLTCHAAIVAREMRKPCVIGTKIATKIFKDGDRVEVDADTGVVKKI